MVLVGQVQREVVGLLNDHGPFAVGISGEDAHLFTAVRRDVDVDGESVDIGLVGDIVAVDAGVVRTLLDDARIPVVSSVARGVDGAGNPASTTSTPTPLPPRWPWHSGRRSWSCSPMSRVCTPTGRTATRSSAR